MAFIQSLSYTAPTEEPEPDPIDLVLGDQVVTYTGAQTLAGVLAGVQNLYQPKMLWHNGKTYYNYHGIYQSEGLGQGYILVYDEKDGLSKPYRIGNTQVLNSYSSQPDTHTQPNMQIDNDGNLFMFQERTHDSPIDIYKGSSFTNMELLAEKINPGTGATAESSYHQMIKLPNGNGWSWCRMTGLFEAYAGGHGASVEASDGFESWGSLIRNTTNPDPVGFYPPSGTGKTRHYPILPYYRQIAKIEGDDHIICIRVQRVDNFSTGQGTWHKFYIHGTPVGTGRGTIFKNLLGTPYSQDVSAANYMDETDLDTNFLFYNSGSESNNAMIPVSTVSLFPKVYIVTGDANTGNLLLHIIDIAARTLVTKSLNITGYHVYDPSVGQGTSLQHMAYIEDGQYLEVGIGIDYPASVIKIHLFRSYDDGDTFEDQGDMFPEIATSTTRVTFPMNYHAIPNNRNFMVTTHDTDLVTANTQITYVKRAAKGAIQAETPRIVVPAASFSDAFNFFDYAFENADLTKTGNNITSVTDRFGLRNATGVSNPQWDTVNAFVLNGTSSHFTIPTTGFSGLTKCTFFALVSLTELRTTNIFEITDATSGYVRWNLYDAGVGNTPSFIHKIPASATLRDHGQYVVGLNEWVLLGGVVDGRCRADLFINGAKQHYQHFGYSTLAHYQKRGTLSYGTISSVRIGMQNLSSDAWYPLSGKRLMMKSTVYDHETYRSLEKKIADLYGITLNYGYQ